MSTQTLTDRSQLTGTWIIDPSHSRLGFSAKHAMVTTVRGQFSDVEGTITIDAADPTKSAAQVVVKTASVDTRSEQRDAHLRSGDFFDVETYPEITFTSTRAVAKGDDDYVLYGDLTIRGITREVALELEYQGVTVDPWGNLRAGFEGSATVNRKDWDLTWNVALEAGGILVSDKVKLSLDVSLTKQA